MIFLSLLFIFPFVYSTKNSENDLLSLETGYHQKSTHDPIANYYSPAVQYSTHYEQPPQLDYIPHPYPIHETPKSEYVSHYKSGPKKMMYPMPDSPYMKQYPPMSYPTSSYSPPPKPYDSYKPKKYSSYALPMYSSEYMKYKPNKKVYKMSQTAEPHPSILYPIDDYYQYKQTYSSPPYPPQKSYSYPYQPEYQSYSTTKAQPPQTYSDYPKQSYNYSPPPPPPSHYSYEPKPEYPKTTYDDYI